jgi:HAMP domain-containing protein
LDKINIPAVTEAHRLIKEQMGDGTATVQIIKNEADDSYLAVGELQGPDWWFVSVFPTQSIKATAHQAALTVFAEGILLLLLILMVVYLVMRAQAEKPLQQLRHAAESIGEGRYSEVADVQITLPLEMKNEIGLLATRFVEMAGKIRDSRRNLERIVEDRTRELKSANATLREMSLLDGLTNIQRPCDRRDWWGQRPGIGRPGTAPF